MCLRFDFIGKPTTQPSVLLNEVSCGTAGAEVNYTWRLHNGLMGNDSWSKNPRQVRFIPNSGLFMESSPCNMEIPNDWAVQSRSNSINQHCAWGVYDHISHMSYIIYHICHICHICHTPYIIYHIAFIDVIYHNMLVCEPKLPNHHIITHCWDNHG